MWRVTLVALGFQLASCSGDPSPEIAASASAPLVQCSSQGLQGIDVYDGQGDIDWDAVARQGVAFAVIKATQGTYDEQVTFSRNWANARRVGLFRSAYHFFDPTEDGAAQAQHFMSVVGALASNDLPPTVDVECPDGDPDCLYPGAAGAAAPSDIAARLVDFLEAVEGQTGKRSIVYTYEDYLASNDVRLPQLAMYPLFLAAPSAQDGCFDVPAPWQWVTLWQYTWTGSVPGVATDVDRDLFLGTAADLLALASQSSAVLQSSHKPSPQHRRTTLGPVPAAALVSPHHAAAHAAP